MFQFKISSLLDWQKQILFLVFALIISFLVNILIIETKIIGPILFTLVFAFVIYLIFLVNKPIIGLATISIYCFLMGFLVREVAGFPYGVLIEVLLIISCSVTIILHRTSEHTYKNELTVLMFVWCLISVLEILNPSGASIEGWLAEMRTVAIYPLLIVFLGFQVIKENKDLNFFIGLFLVLSLIACLNGIKQQHLGLTSGEQKFLDDGASITHVLWGKLRVFSFWDAAQFGCSQAQFVIISTVLAFGNFKLWKRILLFVLAGLFFYGMLISGTRSAIVVIVTGAFSAIILSKRYKILFLGSAFMLLFLAGLKYTHIGSSNYEIYRLRTALNPEDESLNVRFYSQRILKDYLSTRPFGGGLGVTGHWGHKYNSDKFLSTIEPDSYWVKVWVMYGIVGFTIWFCIYMYLLGKGCGLVWKIKDQKLRVKLVALLSGSIGIFFCSYGNEIINLMPSLLVVALSLVMVFQGPKIDHELTNKNKDAF